MEAWHLVYTKPKEEERAKVNLERQQLEVYLPVIEKTKTVKGKKTQVNEPLFTSYIFVRFDSSLFSVATINATRGVVKTVSYGSRLQLVADELIEHLKQRLSQQQNTPIELEKFAQGEKVMLTEGPFAYLEAVFQSSKGEDRAIILLNMLGKTQSLEVSKKQLISK
ncbi:transcription/translation regulatory transformer protein RfaH [Paraferrimonas sp. SM1919]|uniref:transcription/translation regulatory transformer protein RfaH n=1 Tax=Paraferrimonas sp. SM1919 TaxID=2662263 RepID=UPI0013D5FD7D|nr:transcription/translation regulatory transformer protein RfaH [Paraferrimonas sp. SM1919]